MVIGCWLYLYTGSCMTEEPRAQEKTVSTFCAMLQNIAENNYYNKTGTINCCPFKPSVHPLPWLKIQSAISRKDEEGLTFNFTKPPCPDWLDAGGIYYLFSYIKTL